MCLRGPTLLNFFTAVINTAKYSKQVGLLQTATFVLV
jgi:hypothetical protein